MNVSGNMTLQSLLRSRIWCRSPFQYADGDIYVTYHPLIESDGLIVVASALFLKTIAKKVPFKKHFSHLSISGFIYCILLNTLIVSKYYGS